MPTNLKSFERNYWKYERFLKEYQSCIGYQPTGVREIYFQNASVLTLTTFLNKYQTQPAFSAPSSRKCQVEKNPLDNKENLSNSRLHLLAKFL